VTTRVLKKEGKRRTEEEAVLTNKSGYHYYGYTRRASVKKRENPFKELKFLQEKKGNGR